jgi:hypothetical protein
MPVVETTLRHRQCGGIVGAIAFVRLTLIGILIIGQTAVALFGARSLDPFNSLICTTRIARPSSSKLERSTVMDGGFLEALQATEFADRAVPFMIRFWILYSVHK